MKRENIEILGKNTEVVCNENDQIIFAKEIATYQGNQANSTMITVSGYGILTDKRVDLPFTHLNLNEIPIGSVVDYQYIDGNITNILSDAKIGTLKVYDSNGNLIAGESFRPGEFSRLVIDGKAVKNSSGIEMSASASLKAVVGKNLSEIKSNTTEMHR